MPSKAQLVQVFFYLINYQCKYPLTMYQQACLSYENVMTKGLACTLLLKFQVKNDINPKIVTIFNLD